MATMTEIRLAILDDRREDCGLTELADESLRMQYMLDIVLMHEHVLYEEAPRNIVVWYDDPWGKVYK